MIFVSYFFFLGCFLRKESFLLGAMVTGRLFLLQEQEGEFVNCGL